MRQTVCGLAISGLVAAIAIMAAGAAPASACERLAYAGACGHAYGYFGCYGGCSIHERLPDPELQYHSVLRRPQYYYVNQGTDLHRSRRLRALSDVSGKHPYPVGIPIAPIGTPIPGAITASQFCAAFTDRRT